MSASEYNSRQFIEGEIDGDIITELVEFWQRHHNLTVDGYCGPNTIASIAAQIGEVAKYYPLRCLPDGRKPIITSGFYTENPSRKTHKGVDFFYRWQEGDPEVEIGDGGAVAKRGKIRWWYPENACAVAAADGIVQKAGNTTTGHRVWVIHRDGMRTGYFHLKNTMVEAGQKALAGTALGLIGDNPKGFDGKHLHFEVSPADRYAPKNPRLWLKNANYLEG